MARKDTFNALQKRGIDAAVADKLLQGYTSITNIASASPADLLSLGLTEEQAADVISKLGKTKRESGSKKAAKKEAAAEPTRKVEFQRVVKAKPVTPYEAKLDGMLEELNLELPRKVVVTLAERLEGTNVSEAKIKEILTRSSQKFELHKMDANESAGILAAQSIGEPGTQMTMRLEDFSADGNVVLPASIVTGNVFWDVNGDGRYGTGDEYISGANVTLTNNDTGFTSTVATDANGSYRIVAVAGESNYLYATYDGHTFGGSTMTTVAGETANRNLAIQPGKVTGTLTFSGGGTAEGVGVSITDTSTSKVTNTTTGTGGTFNFDRLLPGNYTVDTTDSNISAGSVSVTVTAGSTQNVNLSVQAATQVSGSVTLNGVAQSNVAVGFLSAGREMYTTTDSSGNYKITLPQDTYTVYALTNVGGTDEVAMEQDDLPRLFLRGQGKCIAVFADCNNFDN